MAAAAAAAVTPADVTDEVVGAVDGAEAPEGGKPKKKLKLSRKKLMMLGGVVLLLVGLGGGAMVMGVPAMILGGGEAGGEEAAEVPETVGVFFDLPEMLVNLSTNGKKLGFLKLRVALELADEEAQAKVEAVMPRIVDTFQTYLRGLRMEDLNGSAGLYRLREELLLRVGAAVKPVEVKDVLFKEMLVQ